VNKILNILLVEDNPGDALLLEEELLDVPNFAFTLEHVATAGAAVERLGRGGIDAVLLDLSLPDAHGLETVQKVYPAAPLVPMVVLSGTSDEAVATLSLKEGVQDYLIKGESGGRVIARTLTYALERNRMGLELKETRTRAEVLAALADALQAARSPSGVSQSVVETLAPALEASFMFTLRTGEGRVWLDATWGEIHPAVHAYFRHPGFTVAGTALLSDPNAQVGGVYSQVSGPELWPVPGFPQLSFAAEPILRTAQEGGGELEGFITTWRVPEQGEWTPGERELLERSSAAVSLALEKAEMSAALEKRNSVLEERINLALRAANMLAWDWDLSTDQVTFLQPIALKKLGEVHQNLTSQQVWSLVHPDDFPTYRAHLEQMLSREGRGTIRVRTRALGGVDYGWVEEHALVRRDEAGRAIGLSAITLDIHQRILAEQQRDQLFGELERERLQLEAILTELPVGVIVAEAGTGRVIMTNRQAEVILGHPDPRIENFEDYARYQAVHPDGSAFAADEYPLAQAAKFGEYGRDIEFKYRKAGVETIVVSVNTGPILGKDGSPRGAVAIFSDVTERIRAEREREKLIADLERERSRLAAVLRELPVGVILADGKTGEVLLSNPQADALLRRDMGRVDGLDQHDQPLFFYPDGRPVPLEELPALKASQRGEYVREQELLYARSPQEKIILSINTGPVRSEEGVASGLVLTLRDITERRTASARIEASEARFRMYADNIQDALYISSPSENRIEYLSPAFAHIWGMDPSSVMGNWAGILSAVHPDDRQRVQQSFLSGSSVRFDVEYRLLREGGEIRWIRDRGFALEGMAGMVAGIAQDITERKTAELERIQSEERLLLALESSGVVFFEWDARAGMVAFQGGADVLFGLEKGLEQISQAEFGQLILEQDREIHLTSLYNALNKLERYATDIRVVRHNSQIRWVQGRGKVVYQGGNPVINGVFLDITDRKLAELARTESEERLQLALSSSGVVFWQWVESRRKIFFDGSAAVLFGLPPETRYTDAETFLNLIVPEDRASFEQDLQQALSSGERYASDHRIVRGGQVRWIQGRGKVALEDGLKVINGVFLDITERKIIELRLRELNEAQKRFVSDAAHELRAPLTAIQGNLELVRLYPQMSNEDRLEAVGDAEREAARLGRLVADLLTLARGDSGVQMVEDDLRLDEVLSEAWRGALSLGRGHRMELLTLEPCVVLGDRDRLKQLTLILLENALKYTPEGGKVTLELRSLGDAAEFWVRDTGVGIADASLEKVFERFYRTDEARVRGEDPGGTGLGLSIAKWIAELHGGVVWLESAEGQGTVAVVRLPRLALEG